LISHPFSRENFYLSIIHNSTIFVLKGREKPTHFFIKKKKIYKMKTENKIKEKERER
jgi:hypothetical protein